MTFRIRLYLAACFTAGIFVGIYVLSGTVAFAKRRAPILHKIHRARNLTWHYQRALVVPLSPYRSSADRSLDLAYRQWVLGVWQGRLVRTRALWHHSPVRLNLLCIHSGEGAWNANTGNGYYGGLQMNADFERAYAPGLVAQKGHAHHWTPLEQMTAGARAVKVRGYSPWPVTSARCGL